MTYTPDLFASRNHHFLIYLAKKKKKKKNENCMFYVWIHFCLYFTHEGVLSLWHQVMSYMNCCYYICISGKRLSITYTLEVYDLQYWIILRGVATTPLRKICFGKVKPCFEIKLKFWSVKFLSAKNRSNLSKLFHQLHYHYTSRFLLPSCVGLIWRSTAGILQVGAPTGILQVGVLLKVLWGYAAATACMLLSQ